MKFDTALIISIIYLIILIYTLIRIVLDTHSTSKTLAYALIAIVFPVAGILFYYALGINYRHHRLSKLAGDVHRRFDDEYLYPK